MSYLYLMPPQVQAHLAPYYKLPYIKYDQEQRLETSFQDKKNPNSTDIIILAAETGLTEEGVKVWFEHRLACWRQSQGLPANQSSLTG